jgi:glycerol-3-phosphate dehydrogenase subunit B
MPTYDVVVVGAGLAGLTTAVELAERGARVHLAAKGMAASHWAHGGVDVAAPPGASSALKGIASLRRRPGHPYQILAAEVEMAIPTQLDRLAEMGLPYHGSLASPLRLLPTPIGGLRPAAIVPEGQAAGLSAWGRDEGLLLLGIDRYRDFWPHYAARNLRRQAWADGPAEIRGASVELPGLATLRNLSTLVIARLFDDSVWRDRALAALRTHVPPGGRWRIGLPAVLGIQRHADVMLRAANALGHPVFEIPTLPPSVPGMRLFEALRARATQKGATMQIGFEVVRVGHERDRVTTVETDATVRSLVLRAGEVVLATGGIAGGGLRASREGVLEERVIGLPVEAPARGDWFDGDLYSTAGIVLESAGIRVDNQLRPIGTDGDVLYQNVRIVGSALAGMHYLSQRCGDGVAIASAARAARLAAEQRDAPPSVPEGAPGAQAS